MAGFATLSGGDTVSFSVDLGQAAAVQAAITALNSSFATDTLYTSIQAPVSSTTENVFLLDGGTTVPFVGGNTNAVILDSVNAFTATDISTADYFNMLVVGNEGNDSISILAASSVIAGSGQDTVSIDSWHHGGGANYVNVGNGNDSLTMVGNGTLIAGDGSNTVDVENSTWNGTDVVTLGNGDNNVTINTGYATVTAGNGSNVIDLNAGADPNNQSVVNLGSGSDTINLASGPGYYWFQSTGSATVYGSSSGMDSMTAAAGNITLDGSAATGNDTFVGGTGMTSMIGGTGENFFYGGSGSDTMVAGTNLDQNSFNFDGTKGGTHVIQGYDNDDVSSLNLNFSNYGADASYDQSVVDGNLVISITGAGIQTTTITINDVTTTLDASHFPAA